MKNKNILFLMQPPFFDGASNLHPRGDLPHQIVQLATYIREIKSFSVSVFDGFVENFSFDKIIEKIEELQPQTVVMPLMIVNREIDYKNTFALCNMIKKNSPEIRMVLINWFYVQNIEVLIKESHCMVEYFLFGDIEISLPILLDFFEKKHDISFVPGLIYKAEKSWQITPGWAQLADLDKLPIPDWSLININAYQPMPHRYENRAYYTMNISRGCDWNKCLFCQEAVGSTSKAPTRFLCKSPEKVVAEIILAQKKYQIKEIQFDSIQFPTEIKWLEQFRELLKKNKININWTCLSRINAVNQEKLKIMRDCGCVNILFGIESLDKKQLKFLQKGHTKKDVVKIIKVCRKFGIKTTGSFLMGLPQENPIDILLMAFNASVIGFDYYQLFIAKWYARLPKKLAEYGKVLSNWDYPKYDFYGPIFLPKAYKNVNQLKFVQKLAYVIFYLNLATIIRHVFDIRRGSDFKRKIQGIVILIEIFSRKRKNTPVSKIKK